MSRAARQPAATLRRVNVRVRLFAGLREQAGSGAARDRARRTARRSATSGRCSASETSRRGCSTRCNRAYVDRNESLSRGRRGRGHPARLGRRLPALRRAALRRRGRRRGARRRRPARSRRSSARRARTRAGARSLHLEYEAYEGMAEQVMADLAAEPRRAARALQGRDPPPRRAGRDRRDERRHRRLRAAPRRRARRVQGGDRRAQGLRPALEERDLRRR